MVYTADNIQTSIRDIRITLCPIDIARGDSVLSVTYILLIWHLSIIIRSVSCYIVLGNWTFNCINSGLTQEFGLTKDLTKCQTPIRGRVHCFISLHGRDIMSNSWYGYMTENTHTPLGDIHKTSPAAAHGILPDTDLVVVYYILHNANDKFIWIVICLFYRQEGINIVVVII